MISCQMSRKLMIPAKLNKKICSDKVWSVKYKSQMKTDWVVPPWILIRNEMSYNRKDGEVCWLRTIIRKGAESSPRKVIIRTDILIRKQTFILAAQAQGCNWQTLERRDKTKRGLSRKWRKMNSKMFWKLVSSENLL